MAATQALALHPLQSVCSMHLLRGARRICVLRPAPAMPIQNAAPARKQHQQAAAPGRTTLRTPAPRATLPACCWPQLVLLRNPAQGSSPSAAGSAAHASPAPQDSMRWEQLIVTGASALTTVLLARKLKQRRGSSTASGGGAAAAALQRDMHFWTPSEALAPGLSDARAVVTLKPSHGQQQRASSEGMQFASVALVACIALLAGAAGGMVLAGHGNTAPTDAPWHAWHAWQPSSLSILAAVALISFFLGVMCASASAESAGEDGKEAGLPGMAGGVQADTTPQPPPARINPELSGTWVKCARLSDPMDEACDVMQLNGIVRAAIRLVRGIEVHVIEPWEGGHGVFEMAVFSVFPWFKVRERYELDGSVSMWNRRDLRTGKHRGCVRVLPSGGVLLQLRWDAPYAGEGTDEFQLVGTDELHVTSRLQPLASPGRTIQYRTVYMRKRP